MNIWAQNNIKPLTIGWVLSLAFSRSPWSKNSSATRLARRCCCSQGLAMALTSQAVISIPQSTKKTRSDKKINSCLILLLVTKCFVPVQIFWASSKIWLHLVPLQKLLCGHRIHFYWMQIIFLSGTKSLWLPQYVNKFLVWHKKFGSAQNILGPVKGQGISYFDELIRRVFFLLNKVTIYSGIFM